MGIFDPTFESVFLSNNKCFLGQNIPGKSIKKSLGLISMVTKGINGNITKVYEDLMCNFIQKLEELGGNAITNFRFETGSYQQQGSAWVVTYLLIYGEAVSTD
jgi:uncharacterized protein YbjQ (UPF0145 family)